MQRSESSSHRCKSLHSGFCHLPWLQPAMGSLPGKTFMWSRPSCRTGGLKISIARFSISNNFHPSPWFFFSPPTWVAPGKWHHNFLCGFTIFAGLPPTTRFLRMCMLFLTPQDSLGKSDFVNFLSLRKEEIASLWFLKPLPSGQTCWLSMPQKQQSHNKYEAGQFH